MTKNLMTASEKHYVLVVDNDPFRSRILAEDLKAAGCYVARCTSGQEALRYVIDYEPDALISDWELPDMDGLELARQVTLGRMGTKVILQQDEPDWHALRLTLECGGEELLARHAPVDQLLRVLGRNADRVRTTKRLSARAAV